jgi:formylglycine-generating enzyme required for sulfatase activity
MATKPPDAFLSYTRFDDRHDGGAISEFRVRLADAIRAVTGEPFEIFQDIDGIGLGEHWPGKLDQALRDVRFFIPIITPSYFTSKACREELERFLRAEADRGRSDLVLPIYYIESDVLEDAALRAADPLASMMHERQRHDWRELRFEPFDAARARKALECLAREIVGARRRAMPVTAKPSLDMVVERSQLSKLTPTEELILPTTFSNGIKRSSGEPKPKKACSATLKAPVPGTIFRDIDAFWCPEMIVIPAGEFIMGSTDAEREWVLAQGFAREWIRSEKPQHRVTIRSSFAVGRFSVTFEEYDRYANAAGQRRPCDQGWGRGCRPVVDVSWEDTAGYLEWLRGETGQPYRLLTEAEWEYAVRAGTTTRYWWGEEITPRDANYGDNVCKTSEAGSYPPNPWGLYDMLGNVWEWVQDCWYEGYEGAPGDGSAWTSGDCSRRVVRGGSWHFDPWFLRSAFRIWYIADLRSDGTGFRVARPLISPDTP